VIISTARSGTKYLISLLSSHPNIACEKELFNHGGQYYKKVGLTPRQWHNEPETALAHFWALYDRMPEVKAAGFKVLAGQNQKAEIHLLQNPDIKKIILYRRNHLRQFYSELAAQRSGFYGESRIGHLVKNQLRSAVSSIRTGHYNKSIWRFRNVVRFTCTWLVYGSPYVPRKLTVLIPALQKYIQKKEKYFQRIDTILCEKNQPFLRVDYEDLDNDTSYQHYTKILDFLGVSHQVLTASEKKLHSMPLQELVANYDELEKTLRNTPYYTMLTEG
jgi:hypothetical protein